MIIKTEETPTGDIISLLFIANLLTNDHQITDLFAVGLLISYPKPKDPMLTANNGKIPWHAYEVRSNHIAMKYWWNGATKLTKLVDALYNKVLTFYSTLHENVHSKYRLVCNKFNARFSPKSQHAWLNTNWWFFNKC